MIYYICIAVFIYLLGLIEINENRRSIKKSISFLSAIILILFAGLKINGATDYIQYRNLFDKFETLGSLYYIELGYQFLMYLIKWLGGGFLLFYFIVAVINVSIKTTIIYKLTPIVGVALLMYFCGCFFERDNDGIRQGVSMSFCFVALYYLVKNQIRKYFIFTIIAVLFHYTSLVFFGAFLLKKIKWSSKTIILILGCSYVISITSLFLTQYIVSYIPIEMISKKLELYSSNDYSRELGINIGILFRTILLLLFMFYRFRINIKEDLYLILRNGLAFSIVCTLVFGDFLIIAHRLPYVYREFQIFIVPYLISALPNKEFRMIGLTLVLIYSYFILSRFFINDSIYNEYTNLLFSIVS